MRESNNPWFADPRPQMTVLGWFVGATRGPADDLLGQKFLYVVTVLRRESGKGCWICIKSDLFSHFKLFIVYKSQRLMVR